MHHEMNGRKKKKGDSASLLQESPFYLFTKG